MSSLEARRLSHLESAIRAASGEQIVSIERLVAERCRRLDPTTIRPHTDFHWWPRPIEPV
ncbi:MAG TPA: hypothetical protein VF535_10420 [Allosphingosinicella sp.]